MDDRVRVELSEGIADVRLVRADKHNGLDRRMFEAAYPGQRFQDMTFAHASNASAGFLTARLAFNNSPWDRLPAWE